MNVISEYEYNLARFNVGCKVMEERYGVEFANVILQKKAIWNWIGIQQMCIDIEVGELIRDRKLKGVKAVEFYRKALEEHLEGVHFNRRFKKRLLIK